MKTKFMAILLSGILGAGFAYAVDFSKVNNQQLIDMAGTVKPKDYPDYRIEVNKRIQEMKVSEAREFREKMRLQARSVYDKMSVAEHRAYRDSIREEMDKKIQGMSEREFRESGLRRGGIHGMGMHHQGGYRGSRGDCLGNGYRTR
ncbi:hypothetical protein B6S12_06360 [Helicobacter valdiviensis]|uniref:DUF1104 domain-containing protein n=1 Tax=Helicobacter valdiviensis TaxID=1458358 RepID=A0A2W6MTS5_9HELI|nr:DUF1104 domain-containing protein [Helicobacter valdiviensis]PZT47935.1 hypothetical protein B6S12_06360 [Helicobacter valdiviensis]